MAIAIAMFVLGAGVPACLVTLTSLAVSDLPPEKVANGSGLQNFIRIMAMAVGASLTSTYWEHATKEIRHYGLLAGSTCKVRLELARELLGVVPSPSDDEPAETLDTRPPCPCCGGHMIVIETFERWQQPRAPPSATTPIRKFAS
jgi:hypothetical protein